MLAKLRDSRRNKNVNKAPFSWLTLVHTDEPAANQGGQSLITDEIGMDLKETVCLITGGASGLGAATARDLVARGAQVVVSDINRTVGESLAKEIGGRFVPCDITSIESAKAAINASLEFGPLRVLVNCAGVAPAARTVSHDGPHDLDLFTRAVQINLIGAFNIARLAAHAMQSNPANADGERGVMIMTASVAAYEGQIGQTAYAASKGGIVSMVLPMARDLARHGIRVMAIAPGLFETPALMDMPNEVRNSLGALAPFPSRLGRSEEFARLVAHMIDNPMLNGETIRLDGALRMPPQ